MRGRAVNVINGSVVDDDADPPIIVQMEFGSERGVGAGVSKSIKRFVSENIPIRRMK